MSPRPLPTTRLAKVPGERRWVAKRAYITKRSTPGQIAGLLHAAEHDLAHAADPATEVASRYRAAVQAALNLATIVLRASGYVTSPAHDPQLAFEALPDLFGPEGRRSAKIFLAHYRKSRRAATAQRPAALERALAEILREAGSFRESVLEWLRATRRHLLPAAKSDEEGLEGRQGLLF
jgi:hypothetical protein